MAARLGCADRLPKGVPLRRVVPISPIGDLAPLMRTEMNDLLGIDAQEARAESPIRRTLAAGVSAHVWVGAAERPSFLEQADDLACAWDVPLTRAQGRHHYDVLSELAQPDSPLTETMLNGL